MDSYQSTIDAHFTVSPTGQMTTAETSDSDVNSSVDLQYVVSIF